MDVEPHARDELHARVQESIAEDLRVAGQHGLVGLCAVCGARRVVANDVDVNEETAIDRLPAPVAIAIGSGRYKGPLRFV